MRSGDNTSRIKEKLILSYSRKAVRFWTSYFCGRFRRI